MDAIVAAKTAVKLPSLRHHKGSGQGFVILSGRTIYCGKFGLPQTQQRYLQVTSEWLASGRQLPVSPAEITIMELTDRFYQHAQQYYMKPSGELSNEVHNIKLALRPIKELYGCSRVADFGPLALKAVRQRMIDHGLCRTNINKMVGRLKLMFRWATEEEIIPGSIHHALSAVKGLSFGRSGARESVPVKPVPQERIDAVKPFVTRQVWAMIQVQLCTAARPGEIILMRPCDIDRSGPVWFYTPKEHKTLHHGHSRIIYIGPKCQQILAPFLLRPPEAFMFSPREAMEERRRLAHENRKTPLSCGNRPGTNRKDSPTKRPGEKYTICSYEKAIRMGCKKAYRPTGMTDAEFKTWKCPQHWHPHQLRHNAATELRRESGLDAARIVLGHRSPAVTTIYAEEDARKALEVILKVG